MSHHQIPMRSLDRFLRPWFHRLAALAAALALAVPSPAYALKVQAPRETGLEEQVAAALGHRAEDAAGLEEPDPRSAGPGDAAPFRIANPRGVRIVTGGPNQGAPQVAPQQKLAPSEVRILLVESDDAKRQALRQIVWSVLQASGGAAVQITEEQIGEAASALAAAEWTATQEFPPQLVITGLLDVQPPRPWWRRLFSLGGAVGQALPGGLDVIAAAQKTTVLLVAELSSQHYAAIDRAQRSATAMVRYIQPALGSGAPGILQAADKITPIIQEAIVARLSAAGLEEEPDRGRPRTPVAASALHVFVVDDTPSALELNAQIVGRVAAALPKAQGFDPLRQLHRYTDSRRLIEDLPRLQAQDIVPDLLLTDLNMPGPDGFEVADVVRKINPGVYIVLVTAPHFNQSSVIDDAVAAGRITRFVDKGGSLDQFEAAIRASLAAVLAGGLEETPTGVAAPPVAERPGRPRPELGGIIVGPDGRTIVPKLPDPRQRGSLGAEPVWKLSTPEQVGAAIEVMRWVNALRDAGEAIPDAARAAQPTYVLEGEAVWAAPALEALKLPYRAVVPDGGLAGHLADEFGVDRAKIVTQRPTDLADPLVLTTRQAVEEALRRRGLTDPTISPLLTEFNTAVNEYLGLVTQA